MTYIKRFPNTPAQEVLREVTFQRTASEYGLAPDVLDTDNATFIAMEDLDCMNIADMYGESIEDIPENVRCDIWDILWTLYSCAGIEYLDVTPYNFIEKDGKTWVIDYGHAKKTERGNIDPWLIRILSDDRMILSEWNPEFF